MTGQRSKRLRRRETASLRLADGLITDYGKLFGENLRLTLQTRLGALKNKLEQQGQGDLSPRVTALGGPSPNLARGIWLFPTLLHDAAHDSSTKMTVIRQVLIGRGWSSDVVECWSVALADLDNRLSRLARGHTVMPVPTWVDFESAERSAAVMTRGLSGSSEAWGTLLAHAQAVLASRTDGLQFELHNSYDFAEWRDLVAAARILDLAATEFGINDSENRKAAAILAACAFGMSGTAVSATAAIRGHHLLDSDLSPSELTALALSSPVLSREVVPGLPVGSKHKACIENVVAFLAKGGEGAVQHGRHIIARGNLRGDRRVGKLLATAQ